VGLSAASDGADDGCATAQATAIVVDKTVRKLTLLRNGDVLNTYDARSRTHWP
jgi:hypothetical protein